MMTKFCLALVIAGCVLTWVGPGADSAEGQYYRIKNVQSKQVLSVSSTDKEEGALIVLASQGDSDLQQWKFVKIGDHYKIVNRTTGLALNVQSESYEEGAPIIQWDASVDNENQQWSLVKKGEFFAIKARHSGMVLDVAGGTKKRKASVIQYPLQEKENASQIFEVVAVAKPFPQEFKREKPGDQPVPGGWAFGTPLMFVKPRSGVPFGDWVDGKQVDLSKPLALVVSVRKDNGDGWVRIFDGRREGWVRKESLVALQDARPVWDRMLTANPKDAYALMMRGLTSAYNGDHDQAIADYTGSLRIDPKSFDAVDCRGYAWLAKKEYDQAIADFTEASKLDPQSDVPIFQRGLVRMYKQDYDRAIADFTEARKLEPGNWSAIVSRGDAWLAKKEYDQAIADFTEASQLNPQHPQPFGQRGNAWLAKKEYDKAIADFTEANRLAPMNSSVFLARGGAWLAKKDYDQAIADFTEMLKHNPQDVVALAARSDSFYWAKDYRRSLEDRDAEILLRPKDVAALVSRAMVQAKLKKYDAAVTDFEKALELNPSFMVQREYAKFRASCPDAAFRDGKKAVELAKGATEKVGKGAAGWRALDAMAMAFAETGDFDRAVAQQERAVNRLENATDSEADELKSARARLELYKAKKPYRDE